MNLPDDIWTRVLAVLDFGCAYKAGLTCKRMYNVLLGAAAPEVACGWQNVPALLPGESRLMRLAFLYAQRSGGMLCVNHRLWCRALLSVWKHGTPSKE
jgi:hypothetical protein